MKFLHIGDLHLGKRVNEISMLAEQKHILSEIAAIAEREQVDGILAAGDLYDKSTPSAEAVRLLDGFLTELSEKNIPFYGISGNHDSAERLAFAAALLKRQGVTVSPVFDGTLERVDLTDAYGPLHLYLMPFLKPAMIRPFFPEKTIESYEDGIACVLEAAQVDPAARNVLIAHQFVVSGETTPERCDSETIYVGGVDSVSAGLFDAFDYVALGHLHGEQSIGRETVRYSGSPLKYSFSEVRQQKGALCVTMGEKGSVTVEKIPLTPLHDMREIRGPIDRLLAPETAAMGDPEDYLHVTLTDTAVMDAAARVRQVYPNLMKLDFDNAMTRSRGALGTPELQEKQAPLALFAAFYEQQNQEPLDGEKLAYVQSLLGEGER